MSDRARLRSVQCSTYDADMHSDRPRGVHALLLNGTAGVGKTTIAEAVGDLLADSGSLMSCSTSTG